jgi:hypothetical protein
MNEAAVILGKSTEQSRWQIIFEMIIQRAQAPAPAGLS